MVTQQHHSCKFVTRAAHVPHVVFDNGGKIFEMTPSPQQRYGGITISAGAAAERIWCLAIGTPHPRTNADALILHLLKCHRYRFFLSLAQYFEGNDISDLFCSDDTGK